MCTANPARATRKSIGASTFSPHALPQSVLRMPSGMRPPTVWKCSGSPESSIASHSGIPVRIVERRHVERVGHVEAADPAALDDALHLGDGGLDGRARDAGEAGEALGVRVAEVGEPVVVDPDHLDGRLGIGHARARAEDAVEHLGLDAVAVLVLQAQLGLAEPPDARACRPRRGRSRPCGPSDGSARARTRGRPSPCRWRGRSCPPFLVTHMGPLGPSVT